MATRKNVPADIPRLWDEMQRRGNPNLKLIRAGAHTRRDTGLKRLSSKIANGVRSRMLRDATPDGCGIRLVEREALLNVPNFNHMHRFIPALIRQAGWDVDTLSVSHRPRGAGNSHYGLWNRLWVGIVDLFGVAWLGRRSRPTTVQEQPVHDRNQPALDRHRPDRPGQRPPRAFWCSGCCRNAHAAA